MPINGARLIGKNGVVVLPDGQYAAESFYTRDSMERLVDYFAPKRRPRVRKPGAYFPVMIVHWASPGNYYHWMHDSLTRLYQVLDILPDDTRFIVSPDMTPLQRECFGLFGIEDRRLVPFDTNEIWELDTLHFAPPTTMSGSDRVEVDRWMRATILDAYGIEPRRTGRRIYISRRNAARHITNENAVEALLSEYSFEVHTPERLSLRDQVALFAGAEVVVAPHGAGLTNILFAPDGLRLVEIIEPTMVENAYIYWAMADALGHEYWYVLGESGEKRAGQHDMHVPVDKLAATFERMGLDPGP